MAKFLSFRDGGKTDQEGISKPFADIFTGEVKAGFTTTQLGSPGMGVAVAEGSAFIPTGNGYPYHVYTDAAENVTITTADGSNPRIDLIVAYVDLTEVDDTDPNNPDAFKMVAVAGTPAGSPAEPNGAAIQSAIGASNPYIILSEVLVGTGVTTITNANITDERTMVTVVAKTVEVSTGGGINDENGNELVKTSTTASAVNEVTVKNAATGNAPQIQATGGDTNVDLNLVPKGTGEVTKNGNPIDWWEEIGRTTLESTGSTITVSSLPARRYLKIEITLQGSGGTVTNTGIRLNNDSGNNYSTRLSSNGGTDSTATSQDTLLNPPGPTTTGKSFTVMEVINRTGVEKLAQVELMIASAGAGNAPDRRTYRSKWANTVSLIDRIDVIASANSFASGSEVVVLGHD